MELEILKWIQAVFSNEFLDQFFITFSSFGDWGQIWIVLIIILLINKKTRKLGALMAISLIAEFILNDHILKPFIARARPFEVYDVALILETPTSYAFPSGHTASSFAVVMVAVFKNYRYKVPLVLLASLMAFSRLYLFVHWPTDILGGIVVGTLVAFIVVKIDEKRTQGAVVST